MTDDQSGPARQNSDYVEWEYAVCVLGTVVCRNGEHPRLSAVSGAQDDVAESVMWRRADTDDPWAGPSADWHVDVPGFAPPRRVGTNVGAAQTAGPGGEMLAADVDKPWQFE